MATPSILKKIGDTTSHYWEGLKSLPPGESEAAGLKEVGKNVGAVTAPTSTPAASSPVPAVSSAKDKVAPLAKYGSHPERGEKRLDSEGNVIPSYQSGGDVPTDQVAEVHEGEKVLNPEEAAQYRTEHPEEAPKPVEVASAKTDLKPYSQVVEDRAKEKAAEQVRNPGVQTVPSEIAPKLIEEKPAEEKPKLTYGHILADQWLQKNGMPSMGSLGTPKEFNQGAPDQGAMEQGATQPKALQTDTGMAKPAGLKPIVPAESTPAATQLQGKEAYKAKIQAYDTQYQDLMDRAAKENDPALREQAARVREAKLAYQQAHPWGAPESAHPGVLGKIGHIAEMVASRAPGIAPIMATLPQSEIGMGLQREGAQEQVKEAAAENAAQDKASKISIPGYKQVVGGAVDPKSPAAGPQVAFVNEKDPNDIVYKGPLTAKPSTAADKEAFKAVLKKIGTQEVADPAQQKNALETAHNSKAITDDEYKDALSYLGSTANAPATQATASEEKKVAGKTLYFNTPNGRKALTAQEAKAQGFDPAAGVVENEGQVAKDREKNSTYRVIQNALNQYQTHIVAGDKKLTNADIKNMATITEDSESSNWINNLLSGVYDAMLGHPITGYSEKLMKGGLTKNQYQDMSPDARQLVADYYTTMMAHFANMKASQGTIPRNPFIIQTEMHTIPKPFLSAEEAKPAFQNYLDQVAMRNSDNVDFGGATGAPKEPQVAPPTGATDEVLKDGKVIGHVVVGPNGNKVYQPLQ